MTTVKFNTEVTVLAKTEGQRKGTLDRSGTFKGGTLDRSGTFKGGTLDRSGTFKSGTLDRFNAGAIEGETTGHTIHVGDFARTNFYIRSSRAFIKKHNLTCYVYIHYLHYTSIILAAVSFISFLHYLIAFIFLAFNTLFLIFYAQNMLVNILTMRHVLKQPGLPDSILSDDNVFLEISLEEFTESYPEAQKAGVGIMNYQKGTVLIQVFRKSAKQVMKKCVRLSTVCFISSLLAALICLGFGIFGIFYGTWWISVACALDHIQNCSI